jgi:hypothetical protein
MTQDIVIYDPAVVDQVIALLRTEHGAAVARAGRKLDDARALAIRGDIEPVSSAWSDDDRFWVRSQYSSHRYQVTTDKPPTCDCPDFASTHKACKHIWAVSIVCQARFRFGFVPSLEVQELAAADDGVADYSGDDDVVARAIQEVERYAHHYS